MKTIGVIPKPTKKRLIQLLTLLESYKETKITFDFCTYFHLMHKSLKKNI